MRKQNQEGCDRISSIASLFLVNVGWLLHAIRPLAQYIIVWPHGR